MLVSERRGRSSRGLPIRAAVEWLPIHRTPEIHVTLIRNLVIALALVAAGDLTAALSYPSTKEKWVTVTSGEFQIFSNASERETRKIVTALTQMREAIGKLTMLNVRSQIPVYVYLFRDGRSFGPYRDAIFQRRDANVTGVFLSTDDAKFIALRADVETVDSVVFHELTHYFLDNTASGLPTWFGEGMAEYYSTFSSYGDHVNIGAPVADHLMTLRENLMPLASLFTVDIRSSEYNEGRRQGIFYAQSWALVHYLMQGGRGRQLGQFVMLASKGTPPEEAFRSAFETGYSQLEEELRRYVNRRVMQYRRYSLEELQVPEIAPARPLTHAEVLSALGSLLSRANATTLGDAEAFLAESVRVDPSLARGHAGLGAIYQVTGRLREAQTAFERAVALESNDARLYVGYGSSVLERVTRAMNGPAGAAPADIQRARQLFERATQLDSGSARAWAGLGATWIGSEGDASAGIAALEKSLSLAASQEDTAFHLVQLYARAGRREEAERIIDSVLAKSKDPDLQRHAREALLLADVSKAEALYRAGNRDEALRLMRAVVGATSNERLRLHLQGVIAEADAADAVQKQVAVVNAAILKANGGKVAEALAMLDELLPGMTDGEMKAQVQKLRGEMAARKR